FVPATGTYTGTWIWGYLEGGQAVTPTTSYIGPVIVATRNVPTEVKFANNLGRGSTSNVLFWANSTDKTLHWADPDGDQMNMCAHEVTPMMPPMGTCMDNYTGAVPVVPHLHGGEVPPVLDGGPNSWFTSDGLKHGNAYYSAPGAAGNEAIYRYPNTQEAGPLWFHDHLLGATRLNVYAGLAGAYVLTDPDQDLPANLPGPADIIPLVIQDRKFDTEGQLFFDIGGINPEHPEWIPEFVGDTIVVNGKVWPYLDVQPKRYRFLLINGSNARAYEMFFVNPATKAMGPAIYQIGTDGGYLDAPVKIDPDAPKGQLTKLVMMPGERTELIIDFSGFAGQTLILRNTARTPFPKGSPANGTTTGRIIQVRVGAGPVADTSYNPASGTPIRAAGQRIVRLPGAPGGPAIVTTGAGKNVDKVRELTLNEVMGMGGPLEVLVNNTKWDGKSSVLGPRADFSPVTVGGLTEYYSELPEEGATEVWEIVNLTADAHPIHTHLTQFQLVSRQNFNTSNYNAAYEAAFPGGTVENPDNTTTDYMPGTFIPAYGPPLDYATGNPRAFGGNPDVTPFLQGPAKPPALNEAGWKDTVIVFPGQVTRFTVRYAPTSKALADTDLTFPFDPKALNFGYVWHCHIIDHEDNEMMRPLQVQTNPGTPRDYTLGADY
ncbi:MAG TPA: multicopper oxidase domain-containing protein, partial [Nitrospirota bacterium]